MISAALLSKWHVHANDYAREAGMNPNIQVRTVWDEDIERGMSWAKELGVVFEPQLGHVFQDPAIDAVIVTTPTNAHYEVIMGAIQAGKHVFTEKVLAFTRQECEDILNAADATGVKVMVSLPRLTDSSYLYAQNALDEGLLGRLTSVRCRLAHNGAVSTDKSPGGWLPEHFFDAELCGGGALIDLGAHPIYLTNRLAGQPTAVTARFSYFQDKGVDDNSVAIVEYESGALGVVEAGFVSGNSPFLLEVHGTEGTVIVEDRQVRIKSRKLEEDRWYIIDTLPARLPMPMEQWSQWIIEGTSPSITPFDVLNLTAINEAAAVSNETGKRVPIWPAEG